MISSRLQVSRMHTEKSTIIFVYIDPPRDISQTTTLISVQRRQAGVSVHCTFRARSNLRFLKIVQIVSVFHIFDFWYFSNVSQRGTKKLENRKKTPEMNGSERDLIPIKFL